MKFCKRVLGVHKKSTNFAVLSELGRFPIHYQRSNTCIDVFTSGLCDRKSLYNLKYALRALWYKSVWAYENDHEEVNWIPRYL
jgi:hypothetical protein